MPNARLDDTIQGCFAAFHRGDLDAVMALYETKATMVAQPGQMAEGHAVIREALHRFLAMKPTLTLEKQALVLADDIALLIVQVTFHGKAPDGAPVRMEHTSSDVLRRQADGRWLFVIDNPWGAGILNLTIPPHAQPKLVQEAAQEELTMIEADLPQNHITHAHH